MYTINLNTGTVTRDSDNKVVSPVVNLDDPDYIEYNNWAKSGGVATIINIDKKALAQRDVWELIKIVREKKKYAGVKVGEHWFHSDPDSRTQQLSLAMVGTNLPEGIMWKTLTPNGGLYDPVEIEMTPELAQAIFFTTMQSDSCFHAAAELHRHNMLLCENPYEYNFDVNWPESFEDLL